MTAISRQLSALSCGSTGIEFRELPDAILIRLRAEG